MKRVFAVLALGTILLIPGASAHINNFADTKTIDVGGAYYVQIDPQPQPLYANQTTTFNVYLTSRLNGSYVTQFESIRLTLRSAGTVLEVPLKPTPNETLAGDITFPHRGNYTTTLSLDDGEREGENTTWMDVFHDYGFLVVPVDDFVDPIVNTTTVFHVQTIDPATKERKRVATDMRMQVDHWDNAHTRVLRSFMVDLSPQADGTFKFEHFFDQVGQYHMYVMSDSAGLDYGDVPMLHVFANEPLPDEDNGIPLGPLAALAALAIVARLRRRA